MSEAKLSLKSYQSIVNSHQHDFHQLVLPVNGSLALEIGHSSGEVTSHQAAIICASETHTFESTGDNQFIVADIPPQLAPALVALPVFIPLDENVYRYIQFLQVQLSLPNSLQNKLLQRQMLLLLIQLLDDKFTTASGFDKRLEAARHYLEKNYSDKLALSKAAQQAALSARHLRTLFVQYYAMSPSQYLLELRMQAAWKMLTNSQYSIQIIAERCGYTHLSAFSDRFLRHFSQSPRDVRRLGK